MTLRRVTSGLVLAALSVALATPALLRPGWFGVPEFVADGRFGFGAGAAALGAALLVLRRRRTALLALAAATVHLAPAALLHVGVAPGAGDAALTVATVNLWYGNPDPARFVSFVDRHTPDVLAVLEVSPRFHPEVEGLADRYPHRRIEVVSLPAPDTRLFGMGVLSRHPIRVFAPEVPVAGALPFLRATIAVDGREVDLLIPHVMPPQKSLDARHATFDVLAGAVDESRPTLLLGDLNATSYSPSFGRLLAGAKLADSRRGFGRQPSWAPPGVPRPLGIAIDHVLHSAHFTVEDRFTGAPIGSDHLPVVARLRW